MFTNLGGATGQPIQLIVTFVRFAQGLFSIQFVAPLDFRLSQVTCQRRTLLLVAVHFINK